MQQPITIQEVAALCVGQTAKEAIAAVKARGYLCRLRTPGVRVTTDHRQDRINLFADSEESPVTRATVG